MEEYSIEDKTGNFIGKVSGENFEEAKINAHVMLYSRYTIQHVSEDIRKERNLDISEKLNKATFTLIKNQ